MKKSILILAFFVFCQESFAELSCDKLKRLYGTRQSWFEMDDIFNIQQKFNLIFTATGCEYTSEQLIFKIERFNQQIGQSVHFEAIFDHFGGTPVFKRISSDCIDIYSDPVVNSYRARYHIDSGLEEELRSMVRDQVCPKIENAARASILEALL